MDAKGRKVLNCLTKLGGEQEVFDLSIAVKMAEDAVQELLKALSGEGLVSCRRDESGKEFWSAADAKPAADAGTKEPAPAAAGKKKGKATAAGPDDRFDEFIAEPKAAPPNPSPAPIPAAEVVADSFEPPSRSAQPAKDAPAEEADFEPVPPPKEEKRAVNSAPDFEPKPVKEKTAKKKAPEPEGGASEPKTAKESKTEREFSAGPDDHFDEFAERIPSKPNLPLPLMAGAAILILIVILFIFGGNGGKKKINAEVGKFKTELTGRFDSLATATAAEIEKLRAENKALGDEINGLKAELKKAASKSQEAANNKPAADKPKPGQGNNRRR